MARYVATISSTPPTAGSWRRRSAIIALGILAAVKPLRVLLFDVFGTVVDWRSSLIDLAAEIAARGDPQADWPAIIDDWRRAYQPAMDQIRSGAAWRDLDSLHRETLADVLSRRSIALSAADQESLVQGWRRLRPWPDSRTGLDRLRRRYITSTLSNGHVALLADLLKAGDLRFDVVLSAQLADSYKPEATVYLTALRLLDCEPTEAAMVAAHAADLYAAASLGIRPIFVRRPLEWGPDSPDTAAPAIDGLVTADGLEDLAAILGC